MASLIGSSGLRLAVVGCTHGALDRIYTEVAELEQANGYVVDAVLCCGDFQAIRNAYDLETMVTPNKYRKMEDFWRYYNGEKLAPKLTIFIGGNHEAVSHNRELYYGGWAAPNIYFLGYSGLINLGGLRIGGFSGIYDEKFFRSGHHELTPYSKNDLHSAMYVRLYELWKLAHLTGNVDALMSHDWPEYIAYYGNTDLLLRNNPFFKKSLDESTLGCEAYLALMKHVQPVNWFSGHMHTRFTATVAHPPSMYQASTSSTAKPKDVVRMLQEAQTAPKQTKSTESAAPRVIPGAQKKSDVAKAAATKKQAPASENKEVTTGAATHFLALDKPLPGRAYLEVVHFPYASAERASEPLVANDGTELPLGPRLCYDLEWLSIVRTAHPHFPNHKGGAKMPPQMHPNTLAKSRAWIVENLLDGDEFNWAALEIRRSNFIRSADIHEEGVTRAPIREAPGVGPQTAIFLDWLQLEHDKLAGTGSIPQKHNKAHNQASSSSSAAPTPNEAGANQN
jgi:lariat debranching enzyme